MSDDAKPSIALFLGKPAVKAEPKGSEESAGDGTKAVAEDMLAAIEKKDAAALAAALSAFGELLAAEDEKSDAEEKE